MILTLCGSARFEPYWHEANKRLGLAGHICFSLMTFPSIEGAKTWYTSAEKQSLDLAHLAKIDASQGVVMLNIEDYLGESSLRELEWTRLKEKEIFWTIESKYGRPAEQYARSLTMEWLDATAAFSSDWYELLAAVERRPGGRA